MLTEKGFDIWSESYDESTSASDAENSYPFAGYSQILKTIYRRVCEKKGAKVLDIGFGTGMLTSALYEAGCDITGIDFSVKMIETAKAKMPGAKLIKADFSCGLPEELKQETYDFIIATYSLHHLDDERKISFLHELLSRLDRGGQILIGDVAFGTREELNACAEKEGDAWDDEEIYFVIDEMKREFPSLCFEQISYCSGILSIPCMDE